MLRARVTVLSAQSKIGRLLAPVYNLFAKCYHKQFLQFRFTENRIKPLRNWYLIQFMELLLVKDGVCGRIVCKQNTCDTSLLHWGQGGATQLKTTISL